MADNAVRIVIETDAQRAESVLRNVQGTLIDTGTAAKETGRDFLAWSKDLGMALDAWSNIVRKVSSGVRSAIDFAREGAEFAEQSEMLRRSALSIGVSYEQMMETSRKASSGMVSDMNLVKANSTAMRLGIGADTDKLGKLWEIAASKADQYGGSVEEMFEKMVTAIGKGQARLLIDLGVLPEKFNRVSDAAALTSKRGELLNVVLQQGATDMAALGDTGLSTADKIAQFDAATANLKVSFSELVANGLGPVVEFLAVDFIPTVTETVKALADMYGITDSIMTRLSQQGVAGKIAGIDTKISRLKAQGNEILNRGNEDSFLDDLIGKPVVDYDKIKMLDMEILALDIQRREILADHSRLLAEQASEEAKIAIRRQTILDKMNQTVAPARAGASATKTHRQEADHLTSALKKVSAELMKGFGVDGKESVVKVGQALMAATAAAGGFALALKDGVTDAGRLATKVNEVSQSMLSGAIGKIASGEALSSATPASIVEGFTDFMGVGWMLRGKGKKPSSADIESRAREVIEEPLSRVFNDALVEGLEGGNFFKALGDGVKKTVVNALANSITSSLFKQSGAISRIISDGGSATTHGGASTDAANGLRGGILFPMRHRAAAGGGINWGGVASNVGVGTAISFLTSPGRLFGGTVTHGGEVPGQAADINSRVEQAQANRDELLKRLIGVSQETVQGLRDLTFYAAGYTVSKSGDGIFSKKTKTYELDATEANARLEAYSKLAAKAAAEAAAHQSQINITAVRDPMAALSTTIADLTGAIAAMGSESATLDPENYFALLLQLEQAKATQDGNRLARVGNNFSFLVSNPLGAEAMAGSADPMAGGWLKDDGSALDYAKRWAKSWKDSQYSADARMQFAAGGPWYTGGEIGTRNDILTMMTGITGQAEKSYAQQAAALEAGDDPEKLRVVLKDRLESVTQEMALIGELMASAGEAAKSDLLDIQHRTAAFESWQKATQEYYATKLEGRQIEAQLMAEDKAAAEKAKADNENRINDMLGAMLTHMGEMQEIGGKQVIVLSPGQPDAKAMAIQIKESLAGSNPELAATLEAFITAVSKPRWY